MASSVILPAAAREGRGSPAPPAVTRMSFDAREQSPFMLALEGQAERFAAPFVFCALPIPARQVRALEWRGADVIPPEWEGPMEKIPVQPQSETPRSEGTAPDRPVVTPLVGGSLDPLAWFKGSLDRWFDELAPVSASVMNRFSSLPIPAVDVVEKPGSYEVSIEVPGMDADDIEVRAVGTSFHILGEKRDSREETDRHFRFAERRYGRFERTIPLPADCIATDATASYDKGVLRLVVPRVEGARADVKVIPVTSGS